MHYRKIHEGALFDVVAGSTYDKIVCYETQLDRIFKDKLPLLLQIEKFRRNSVMLGVVLRSMLDDKAIAAALRERKYDMQTRLERVDQRAEKKRILVIEVMERAGLKKLTEPDFTASLRAGRPPIVLIDESAVPTEYWRPQPAKLDKQQLYVALRDGRDIPGAALANAEPTISVRTR